jgi:hypothetical protein
VAGELAPVSEPDAVADVAGHGVGGDAPGGTVDDGQLTQALSGRRLLVVLDTCGNYSTRRQHLRHWQALLQRRPLGPNSRANALAKLRGVLGDAVFDQHVAAGSAMNLANAVAYARHQIQQARHQIGAVA